MNARITSSARRGSSASTIATTAAGARRRGPLPERDRGLPEALDLREQVGPAALGDRVAEQRREQADVAPQRRRAAGRSRRPVGAAARAVTAAHPPNASGFSSVGGRRRRAPRTRSPRRGRPSRCGCRRWRSRGAGSRRRSRASSSRGSTSGSRSNTSSPAAKISPDVERVGQRRLVDDGPREVFTSTAVGFICANASASNRWRVSSREVRVDRDEVGLARAARRARGARRRSRPRPPAGVGPRRVEHPHAEPLRAACHGLTDPAEPHDADRLVVHVLAEHHQRSPDPRRARRAGTARPRRRAARPPSAARTPCPRWSR